MERRKIHLIYSQINHQDNNLIVFMRFCFYVLFVGNGNGVFIPFHSMLIYHSACVCLIIMIVDAHFVEFCGKFHI